MHEENRGTLPRYVAVCAISLKPILTSCCQILHWLPDSIHEGLLQVYVWIYWSLEPSIIENDAITFSQWAFLLTITVWGFEGDLFGDCIRSNLFSNQIWLSGTIFLQKSAKKYKLLAIFLIIIRCCVDSNNASIVACIPSTWNFPKKIENLNWNWIEKSFTRSAGKKMWSKC